VSPGRPEGDASRPLTQRTTCSWSADGDRQEVHSWHLPSSARRTRSPRHESRPREHAHRAPAPARSAKRHASPSPVTPQPRSGRPANGLRLHGSPDQPANRPYLHHSPTRQLATRRFRAEREPGVGHRTGGYMVSAGRPPVRSPARPSVRPSVRPPVRPSVRSPAHTHAERGSGLLALRRRLHLGGRRANNAGPVVGRPGHQPQEVAAPVSGFRELRVEHGRAEPGLDRARGPSR
jgi:hypothetical protein